MLRTAEKHHTSPRIVVVTSELHYWAKLDKDVIDSPKRSCEIWEARIFAVSFFFFISKLSINKKSGLIALADIKIANVSMSLLT